MVYLLSICLQSMPTTTAIYLNLCQRYFLSKRINIILCLIFFYIYLSNCLYLFVWLNLFCHLYFMTFFYQILFVTINVYLSIYFSLFLDTYLSTSRNTYALLRVTFFVRISWQILNHCYNLRRKMVQFDITKNGTRTMNQRKVNELVDRFKAGRKNVRVVYQHYARKKTSRGRISWSEKTNESLGTSGGNREFQIWICTGHCVWWTGVP